MADERRAGNDPEPSDRSLLRRFRDGDEDAATELYGRYAHRLRALARAQCSAGLARRVEVEDLVQSVFGSFFRGVRRGDYDVPDGEELWKLFLVIALNKIRLKGLFHRAAKRDVRRTVGGDRFEQAMGEAMGRDAGACTFLQLVINEALEPLPEPQKQMILLRIEGHEVAEIARQTERSKRTVERTLQRFRQQMADLLEVEG